MCAVTRELRERGHRQGQRRRPPSQIPSSAALPATEPSGEGRVPPEPWWGARPQGPKESLK